MEDSRNKEQEYRKGRPLLNKSFLGSFSSGKGSPAQEEAVIKLLQLLAGDVETNPGPKDGNKKKTKECCKAFRCKQLEPRGSRDESNLDEFVGEISSGFSGGNTTATSNFHESRKKFLEKNYPNLSTGAHLHPPVFVADQPVHGFFAPDESEKESKYAEKNRSNLNEKVVFEALKKEFKDENCFMFRSFETGIDGDIVRQMCAKLKSDVTRESGNFLFLADVVERLKRIAKLACISWEKVQPSNVNLSYDDLVRSMIDNFKKALDSKSQEKDIVLVSQLLQAIIHIEVKSSKVGTAPRQLTQFEEYLRELQCKDMIGGWALVRFVVIPGSDRGQMKIAFCKHCQQHILLKSDMEELFNNGQGKFIDRVAKMMKEDKAEPNHILTMDSFHQGRSENTRQDFVQLQQKVVEKIDILKDSPDFQAVLNSVEYKDLEDEMKKRNFVHLVQNMIVLSSMSLMPMKNAIGRVMTQLVGSDRPVFGPADVPILLDPVIRIEGRRQRPLVLDDLNKEPLFSPRSAFFWTKQQSSILANANSKVILYGDFGTGKSLLLHSLVRYSPPGTKAFLISGLRDNETSARGVLDISNKLQYEGEKRITVIDSKDINSQKLRARLQLPQKVDDDLFNLIFDLSKKYPNSTIVVDEILLKNLEKVEKIHADVFRGRLWIGLASQAFYDFQLQEDQARPQLQNIPAVKNQGFQIIQLDRNLRNSEQILDHSYKIQEDKVIESAILQQKNENTTDSETLPDTLSQANPDTEQASPRQAPPSPEEETSAIQNKDIRQTNDEAQTVPTSSTTVPSSSPEEARTASVQARVVEECQQGVYSLSTSFPRASACPTIPGPRPKHNRGAASEEALKNEIHETILAGENIVLLGNSDADVKWILETLSISDPNLLTVYAPTEDNIQESEENLREYLKQNRGSLLTEAKYFVGFEARTLVLAYDNPYSSNFRCNYLRAAVELVLLDRNLSSSMEVDQVMLQWRYTGPHINLEASAARLLHSHGKEVRCIGWQPWKEVLASGSADSSVKVWREGDGGSSQQMSHRNGVYCLDWSVRGDLATGCNGGEAAVWRGGSKLVNLEGHTGTIYSIKFNGSGELICTGSRDKSIRVWEATTGQLVRWIDCGSTVYQTIWIENQIISGCWDGRIQQWSVDQAEADLDLKGHSDRVNSIDFQPLTKLLSSGSSDENVIVQKLDSPSSSAPPHTLTGHKSRVLEVKFSPSEAHILATWDYSGEVRLWDAVAGNCLHLFQCDKDGMGTFGLDENYIHFSPDGKLLACRGYEVKVFRVATKQLAAVCKVAGKYVCWNTKGNKLTVVTKNSDDTKDERRNIVVFDI